MANPRGRSPAALCTAALLLAGYAHADAPPPKTPVAIPTPRLEFVFEELVALGPDTHVGVTPRGDRNITPILGGTIRGPRLNGEVLPGGWDWQLLTTPCAALEANYFIRTDDGVVIHVLNRAPWCTHDGKDDGAMLTVPAFEAPRGRYEWLNYGAFVGTAEDASTPDHPAVRIRFFRAVL